MSIYFWLNFTLSFPNFREIAKSLIKSKSILQNEQVRATSKEKWQIWPKTKAEKESGSSHRLSQKKGVLDRPCNYHGVCSHYSVDNHPTLPPVLTVEGFRYLRYQHCIEKENRICI